MAAHHYVSKFHLRQFCEPASMRTPDPWLWVGDISKKSVKRRAPKNIGTAPDLFDGPGGFTSAKATVEDFLANHVEGPGDHALRGIVGQVGVELKQVPPPLMPLRCVGGITFATDATFGDSMGHAIRNLARRSAG